jgi:hypothetical protein
VLVSSATWDTAADEQHRLAGMPEVRDFLSIPGHAVEVLAFVKRDRCWHPVRLPVQIPTDNGAA